MTWDDDDLELPESTRMALDQFLQDREIKKQRWEDLQVNTVSNGLIPSIDDFPEDWKASQFWYTDETAKALATAILKGATNETRIAVIAAPSVFVQILNLLAPQDLSARPIVKLLEFDRRFGVFDDFVYYDHDEPHNLPDWTASYFDRIICDPPYHNRPAQVKVAATIRHIASPATGLLAPKIVVCTGATVTDVVLNLYNQEAVQLTNFVLHHARGLSNEYRCFANFECADWKWVKP